MPLRVYTLLCTDILRHAFCVRLEALVHIAPYTKTHLSRKIRHIPPVTFTGPEKLGVPLLSDLRYKRYSVYGPNNHGGCSRTHSGSGRTHLSRKRENACTGRFVRFAPIRRLSNPRIGQKRRLLQPHSVQIPVHRIPELGCFA